MSAPAGMLCSMQTIAASTGPTPNWAVVDVETTGTNPAADRVISVAALAVDDAGTVADTLVTLIDAECDPGPTNIHGITRRMLTGQPTFGEVAPRLAAILRGRILVAHNVAFDYAFLAAEARRASTNIPVEAVMCTVELARNLRLGLDHLKLASLAAHWDIAQARPHDALDDALVLTRILPHALNRARELGVPLPIRGPETLTPPVFAAA